jgi:hypothetical protein
MQRGHTYFFFFDDTRKVLVVEVFAVEVLVVAAFGL